MHAWYSSYIKVRSIFLRLRENARICTTKAVCNDAARQQHANNTTKQRCNDDNNWHPVKCAMMPYMGGESGKFCGRGGSYESHVMPHTTSHHKGAGYRVL
jgi:hypothetical protein